MANTNIDVILEMSFLIFSNANIWFIKKKLTWRFYIPIKALHTTKQVEFINTKEFVKMMLEKESKILIMLVAAFKALLAGISIHFS